ncbi:hypothetical protein D9757_005980 [Collybiopsis confluens]|uniref:Asl1-like glycosyl hydrolase catalytic domain-containing protein n=1 Tax=Collybiopsis confluens TaxID=2823264 RepID=A0A8H5HUC1_9AGAR|nr:hypothetical protein D9757_005980 [Collybiopsis confluens]
MAHKLLNLLALSAFVIMACSFGAHPATALSANSHHTPATSPSNNGNGKGCLAWSNGNADLQYYKTDNTSTIYTWSEVGPSDAGELNFTFVPQLWGWTNADAFGTIVVAGYSDAALFVNEPNEAGQANMSPLDAVFLWEQYMEPLRSQGYRLGSAATSSNPNGMNWMNEFFTTCNGGCKPDFMAIHWYGIDADEFKTYVEQWHNTFSLPIWVTEVGYENFNGNDQGNLSEIQSFMSDVTSWMDLQDFIEKFCWSSGTPGSLNGLMNADGTPSSLGYQFIYSG